MGRGSHHAHPQRRSVRPRRAVAKPGADTGKRHEDLCILPPRPEAGRPASTESLLQRPANPARPTAVPHPYMPQTAVCLRKSVTMRMCAPCLRRAAQYPEGPASVSARHSLFLCLAN